MHDIENYNKNGVFFHERNKVYEYEQIQSNSVYRGVRDIDFPIKGNVYENSADYYRKRNISQSELNKTKENWNNKRIKKEEREHKVLNDIKRVKNITVFDKKFDSFWFNELDVELVGSKKDKNGNTILIVNDYGNNLNKIKNQNLIKRYGKNGIKFEKSFVGRQASTLTLDITTRGQMQNDFNKIELNKNLQTDVNEFNKNGIFFTERKAIQKVELLGNEYRVRETKDKDFPVRGVIYTDSSNYHEKRGISKEIIEKTKKDWANEAEKRVKKKQESHNNIEWTKNIKEFNKKSDKWF